MANEEFPNDVLNLAISKRVISYYSASSRFHRIMERVWLVISAGCVAGLFFSFNVFLVLLASLYLACSFFSSKEKDKCSAKVTTVTTFYERNKDAAPNIFAEGLIKAINEAARRGK